MLRKTWNARDQNEKDLRIEADRLYKEIEAGYKMLKKYPTLRTQKKFWNEFGLRKHGQTISNWN